jgi:inner membrane transporter RhtA
VSFSIQSWKLSSAGRFAPVLALMAAIVSLNIGSSFGKHLFAFLGAAGTVTFRVVFSACILLVVWRPWRFALAREDCYRILLYGLVLGLMNLTFYMSLVHLPLGVAIAIEFVGPLSVAILTSRRRIDFLWILMAVLGLALLSPRSDSATIISSVGACFALASAFFWALYIVFGHRLGHLHGGQSTALGMTVAALVVAPFGLAQAGPALLNPELLWSGLVVAVLSSAVPYSLEMFALKRLPKNTFGILCSMEPAVGAIAGLFILGERLSFLQWLAIASVMAASAGSSATAGASREPAIADGVIV